MERWLGSTTGVVKQLYAYSAAENFRLLSLKAGTGATNDNLQNISYTYDDVGNVLTITDAAAYGGSQALRFTYDGLDRLLTACTLSGATCATGNGNYGVYSQRSYAYSNAGNIINFEGTGTNLYYQDGAHKHAVTHVGGTTAGYQKYWYDANGNATRRISGSQDIPLTYDAENRLTAMSGGVTASYVYDADGKRVKETAGGATTVYIGNAFEWTGSTATMKSYYYAGALRVAMRTGVSPGTVNYLLSDHLGSQALTLTSAGARLNTNTELRYYPWGGGRYVAGATPTSYNFTGQRKDSGSGLLFYNARWYDPTVGRFAQADTIVPQPGNPQSLNRYSYCGSNPLKYVDGSGHNAIEFWGGAGGGGGGLAFLAAMAGLAQNVSQQAQNLTVQMAPTVSEMGQVWYVHGNQIIAAADQVSQAAQNAGQAGNTTGSGGLDPKDPRFKELLDQAVHQGADATCPGCKTTNPELLRGKGAIAAKQHVMNPADIGKDGISAWCQGCRSNLPPKFWDHSIGEIQRFAEQIGLDPTKAAVYTPQYGGAGHYSLFIDAIGADGYILPRYAELIDAFLRSMR